MMRWPVPIRLARRELRGGLTGFRIFLACLTLGVAAIATVQSVSGGVLEGLRRDGQSILGGDISVRRVYRPAEGPELAHFQATANLSTMAEMRSMARTAGGEATLVELKSIDEAYPLYGEVRLREGGNLWETLALRDGLWGTAIEPTLLTRLGVELGDRIEVGDLSLEVRAVIEHEPDRIGGGFSLGPRVMVTPDALAESGLVREGSQVRYHMKLRLPPGGDVEAYSADLRERFPDAGWRIRDYTDAAPSLERMIRRLTQFLTLVGLTALLVGGVGVGNAVKSYLDSRLSTIATLKCLGGSGRLVFQTYFTQILILSVVGIALGLAIGAVAPMAVNSIVSDLLQVTARSGLFPAALATAAGFGVLTALTFSLWPLARARDISAADLFRDVVAPSRRWPRVPFVVATALAAAALAGLAIATATAKLFAVWFVIGAAATILLFRLSASLVVAGARRIGRPRLPGLRLALANLCRPGAPTASVVLSLGLGLTVLVAIALIEGNMSRQITDSLPEEAPAFFFVDIQREQMAPFAELVTDLEGTSNLDRVPMLRGRIVSVNGTPAAEAMVNREHAWILRGDRGLTFSAEPRSEHTIVDGEWWPADYAGPPLISVDVDVADGFAIGIGDRLSVNVLGREIEAEIANIREVDWGSMGINFVLVFSPSPLNAAPHTFLATLQASDAVEGTILRVVTRDFPNVTTVRIKDALEMVNDILRKIGTAVRATAGITLFAGTLVLAGAVAAGHRRRVYDAVVLKVLGATRAVILRAFLIEYGMLGLITAAIAAVIGSIAAWAVLTWVMEIDFVFIPGAVVTTTLLCTAVTIGFGFFGTWQALGQKAAPMLRNE